MPFSCEAAPVLTRTASTLRLVRAASLLAVAAFLADWATKSWAVALVGEQTIPLGLLSLEVVRNDAFAFSSGTGTFSPTAVLVARLAALLAVVLLSLRLGGLSRRNATGFALLLAGGLGNAADVIFRDGAVIDFISTGPLMFAVAGEPLDLSFVFNVADLWVFAGIYLLWPQIRALGVRAQQRVCAFERRVLARSGSEPALERMSTQVQAARTFGAVRHQHMRYGERPYTHHLDHVEAVLRRFGVIDEDLLAAAHLHDTVEDTGTQLLEIEALFGARVAWFVDHVTDRPGRNRKERHAATYPRLRDAGEPVQLKLADRIANIETSLADGNARLLRMYAAEHGDFRAMLFEDGRYAAMWETLDALVERARELLLSAERRPVV